MADAPGRNSRRASRGVASARGCRRNAALLTGACRLSRRQVQCLLTDLCGIRLSLGTLIALEADTAQALAQPYQQLAAAVPQATVLGVDETSWREAGTLHWLWTAVTPQFAFYRVGCPLGATPEPSCLHGTARRRWDRGGRAASGAGHRLGSLQRLRASPARAPVLVLGGVPLGPMARDFRAAQDRGGIDAVVDRWVLKLLGTILVPWRRHRQGELTREALLTAVAPSQEALRTPLNWGSERGTRALRALCNDLLARWEALWTWLHVEDCEPTNNAAERALRSAVLWPGALWASQLRASVRGRRAVRRKDADDGHDVTPPTPQSLGLSRPDLRNGDLG